MERVESMVFTSKSAEVKHLVLEFMGDSEQPVSRNEIVKYVQEHVCAEVTDGVVAGAIKMLTCAGEIIPVQRGVYVKGSGKRKATSFEKISNLCRRFQLDLERACTVNVLELTDHEREVYPDFIRNLCQLRDDVRLGSACLDSLVEDVHLAEKNMENKPVETVELNVPALVENAGQDEEKASDKMEDRLLGNPLLKEKRNQKFSQLRQNQKYLIRQLLVMDVRKIDAIDIHRKRYVYEGMVFLCPHFYEILLT